MIEDLRKRFWVSLVLTVPVLFLSPMIQEWIGVNWTFPGDIYVLFGLSSLIFFYGGWPFLNGMKDEIRSKSPGMMTLIAITIVVAYECSTAVVFGLEGKTFFRELATLLLSCWLATGSKCALSWEPPTHLKNWLNSCRTKPIWFTVIK